MASKLDFPIFKTKVPGLKRKFDLNDPQGRRAYFQAKAGEEIKQVKQYLTKKTFIAYMLAKKNAGKGTYTKMFTEIFGEERIRHLSVGDIVRAVHKEVEDKRKRQALIEQLSGRYRGYVSIEEALAAIEGRRTQTLLPTELILRLIEREIDEDNKKSIFIDGFPRGLDQVSYSLFFRELIGYRDDPDVFVLIDVPEAVIDERLKYRRVCPKCMTPRSLKLLPTKDVRYDKETKEFYLWCDNPRCGGARMVAKEGDELGVEPIRERLVADEELLEATLKLHGVGRVLLRNCVPVRQKDKYVDDYELTPEYVFAYDKKKDKVEVREKPWTVKDDQGVESYSLLAPAVVVSLIKQLAQILTSS